MHAVAVPKGVCWCVLLPLYIQCSILPLLCIGGVRTSIVGFHSATTCGAKSEGPAQPQYFGCFGTSEVVSKRSAAPCQLSVIQCIACPTGCTT